MKRDSTPDSDAGALLSARILSQWDQLPLLAVLALVFMYMVAKGEAPSLMFFGGAKPDKYMSPENLWREAIIIGGFTWGLLCMMGASLFLFAKSESGGILSVLEPIRGMLPTGVMAMFFGLLASLSQGRAWVYVGLGLLIACTLAGLMFSLKRLPQLTPLDETGLARQAEGLSGKWIGIFYYHSGDPRILVPRRGGGITLNLAHGRGWCVLVFGMLLPLGLAVLASFGGLL